MQVLKNHSNEIHLRQESPVRIALLLTLLWWKLFNGKIINGWFFLFAFVVNDKNKSCFNLIYVVKLMNRT